MKVTCISDIHGLPLNIDKTELLIIAGDITGHGSEEEWCSMMEHYVQRCKKLVVIAGNHDKCCQYWLPFGGGEIDYLRDSGCEYNGLKIWGSPFTPAFCNWYFMLTPEQDKEHWKQIPEGLDLLITHGPPSGILDKNEDGEHCGSWGLNRAIFEKKPKYHIFGHIHEAYGKEMSKDTTFINCSTMDQYYRPVHSSFSFEV